MQKQTKKQFESFHNLKSMNKVIKANGIDARAIVERNVFGNYRITFSVNAKNLNDELLIKKSIKDLLSKYILTRFGYMLISDLANDFINNFLTSCAFCEHYGLSEKEFYYIMSPTNI